MADAEHELEHRPALEAEGERESRRSLVSARRPEADSISAATRETFSVVTEHLDQGKYYSINFLLLKHIYEQLHQVAVKTGMTQ